MIKRSDLVQLVREVMSELKEANTSGAVGAYQTKYFLGKATKAKKALERQGYKEVQRPKRGTNTKGFDYL